LWLIVFGRHFVDRSHSDGHIKLWYIFCRVILLCVLCLYHASVFFSDYDSDHDIFAYEKSNYFDGSNDIDTICNTHGNFVSYYESYCETFSNTNGCPNKSQTNKVSIICCSYSYSYYFIGQYPHVCPSYIQF
jgi:hypothetical protein